MNKNLLLFLFATIVPQIIFAKDIRITGTVRDLFSEDGIDSAKVEILYNGDSIVAQTVAKIPVTTEETAGFAYISRKVAKDGARFGLFVPTKGTYTLRCSRPGYETVVQKINLDGKRHGKAFDTGDIYMQKKSIRLGEAVVKGTKIQMFHKGDTLVYNADAFLLPEGSMLDDLVKQLPGAEIRDGNVYVKGRLVENLLLGGKDFFNGNPQAALKNLPAYVVSRVKVYDKEGELSRTTGTDMGDKQYVMDVHLKRQYIGSYIGRLNAGYGTEDRHEAVLFAMRFDDRQSFTLTGDFNNLNTENIYKQSASFARSIPDGLHEHNYAAADYRFEPSGKLKLTTNAEFEHRANWLTQGTASETYLAGGNTFGRSSAHSRDRSVRAGGNTRLTLRPRNGRLFETEYSGGYRHTDGRSSLRSASFDSLPPAGHATNLLDSIFPEPVNDAFRLLTLNRLRNATSDKGDRSYHKLTAHTALAFQENLLDLSGSFNYDKRADDRFDTYCLEYPKTGQAADYRHRYTDHDSRRYDYTLQGNYYWKYLHTKRSNGQLVPGYAFSQRYASEQNPLYRLDWLDGWQTPEEQPASLPSFREELFRVIDPDNSYFSTGRTSRHTASLDWLHDMQLPHKGWLEMKATLRIIREEARLNYRRSGHPYHTARRAWLPEPSASLRWRPLADDKNGTKLSVTLQYKATASQPNLRYLLDLTDASDPLAVTLGNPGLKNMHTDHLSLQVSSNRPRGRSLSSSIGYRSWHNLIASEQFYDKESGIRTSRWVNINGNWQTNYHFWCNVPLNRKGNLSMQARLQAGYLHNTDLSFNQGEERTSDHSVGTVSVTPNLTVSYFPNAKSYLNGSIWVDWRNVDGNRADFVRIQTTYVAYQLNGQVTLPGDIALYSSFRLASRYGLNDASLNDTRIVWDASLSRTIKSLTLVLKGSDLLGRNRFTTVDVNAQGRTETFSNTLPRYVLCSLIWSFNKTGKKRQGK